MQQVPNSNQHAVFSFVRQDNESKWFMIFNFSPKQQSVSFEETLFTDKYHDVLADDQREHDFFSDTELFLAPWQVKVFMRTYS